MPLAPAEIGFTIAVFVFFFIYTVVLKKSSLRKMGLAPKSLFTGWKLLTAFTLISFVLIQTIAPSLNLPEWVLDADPIIPLALVVAAQEILFRGYFLNWLEFLGKQKALIIVTIIFAAIHLVHASPWIITVLSLIGGYFWGWHFYRYRNLYLLIVSHLAINVSFNYFFLENL